MQPIAQHPSLIPNAQPILSAEHRHSHNCPCTTCPTSHSCSLGKYPQACDHCALAGANLNGRRSVLGIYKHAKSRLSRRSTYFVSLAVIVVTTALFVTYFHYTKMPRTSFWSTALAVSLGLGSTAAQSSLGFAAAPPPPPDGIPVSEVLPSSIVIPPEILPSLATLLSNGPVVTSNPELSGVLPPDIEPSLAPLFSTSGPVATSNPELSGILPPDFVTETVYITYVTSGIPESSATGLTPVPETYSEFLYSPPSYPAPFGGRAIDYTWEDAYAKAYDFVSQLSTVEKINLTSGTGWMQGPCVGNTGSIERLGFGGLCLQDGPLGVRFADKISGFPCALSSGATFNKGLMYNLAKAQALEHRAKGVDVVLGPVAGPIGLKPQGGRGWEGFGADPYLSGVGTSHAVRAIQDQGLIASGKHFIGNEQEKFREVGEARRYGYSDATNPISSLIDDRSLHEIFAWPFADMVHAGVGSIMCSYNEVNGSQACQNSYLINHILKEEMAFPGFVVSDWNALKSGVASILAGNDMSMPGGGLGLTEDETRVYYSQYLTEAVFNGTIPLARLDDMATRIMAAFFRVGLDKTRTEFSPDGPNFSSWTPDDVGLLYPGSGEGPEGAVNQHVMARTLYSDEMSLQVATEAVILVKNDLQTLPISSDKYASISVIGVASRNGPDGFNCLDQGCSHGTLGSGWGSGAVTFPFLASPLDGIMDRATPEGIRVFYYKNSDTDSDDFITAATRSDLNVIVGLSDSGEGYISVDGNEGDRNNITLWHNAENQILAAAALHPNNVVVVNTVGPIDVEAWIDHPNITAVLISPPQGEFAGQATTNVLFGDVNPSGRLPFTIPRGSHNIVPLVTDMPADGKPVDPLFLSAQFLDYRYYDTNNIDPRFEFGYGLSYSNFTFGDFSMNEVLVPDEVPPPPPALRPVPDWNDELGPVSDALYPDSIPRYPNYLYPYLDSEDQAAPNGTYPYPEGYSDIPAESATLAGGAPGGNPTLWDVCYQVDINVYNNGPYGGAYVAQLYLALPQTEKFFSAPRQLRGFEKVSVNVGESSHAHFDIMRRDLSVWDSDRQTFIVQRGKYGIYIGSSSRDLELYAEFTI